MHQLYLVVYRFMDLAECAAKNGGIWISASGGTCIAAADVISKKLKLPLADVVDMIEYHVEQVTGDDACYWWSHLQQISPWSVEDSHERSRFDIKTVARAALRGV